MARGPDQAEVLIVTDAVSMPLPRFVIVGAMKAATSTLQEQLAAQPGIFMSDPKEPNFFSDDRQFSKGMGWYSGLFAPAGAADLAGEASTHYTKLPTHPRTVSRLKQYLPEARFIYVMRHPIDRLISHYIHEWSMGVYHRPIVEALDRHPELVAYGRYAMQLQPYLETFGPDAVLPVFFDRLVREPQAELERVCRFIGYREKPTWLRDLQPSNVSSERIRRFPFYATLVDSTPATWVRQRLIPRGWRDAIKRRLTMKDRPVLTDEKRLALEREFDRDLAQLGGWMGCTLNCSNFKQVTGSQELGWRLPSGADLIS
jgi:Sulfotransferase family